MKKKNKEKLIISKIDINAKDDEHLIVQVSEKELEEIEKAENVSLDTQYDFVEKKSDKSIGKQLAMSRILGIEQSDKAISKRQKLFKNLFTILFIVFVVGVLFFTAYKDFFASSEHREPFSWNVLWSILTLRWYYFVGALLTIFLCLLLKGAKLSILCKSLTGKFHFKTCFETGIIGQYYNNITPLAVGGQPFEIYHLSKHGVKGGAATALPIATYFLNQLSFVIICVLGLVFAKYNKLFSFFPATFTVLAIIGSSLVFITASMVLLFAMLPRVGSALVNFVMHFGGKLKIVKDPKKSALKTIKTVVHTAKCLKLIAKKPLAFFSNFILSFLEHFSGVTIAYFTLKFFNFSIPSVQMDGMIEWVQIIHLCCILNAAISFVPTPGNSGAADLSFYLLFEMGLMTGLAFPAMTIWRILSFYSFILIGFIFAKLKKRADSKLKKFQSQFAEESEVEFAPEEE